MPTTMENLSKAFAGESMANRKYLAFAKQAEKDGFTNVASLFKAAAEAETIHAMGYLNAMDFVKSTLENLEYAIKGETYEHEEMYPPMYEQAEREGHKAKNTDVKLIIVGDGPAKTELEDYTRQLGLEGRVIFTGYVERTQLVYFYSMAHVFIFASKVESQGLVILESMTCGTPVVAIGEMGD